MKKITSVGMVLQLGLDVHTSGAEEAQEYEILL